MSDEETSAMRRLKGAGTSRPLSDIELLVQHLEATGGHLSIVVDDSSVTLDEPRITVAYEFGREAPDSPMAAGASYDVGSSLEEALEKVVEEVGLRGRH